MTTIDFSNLGEKLVEAVPELRPVYEAELEWWRGDNPGAYNIFGPVFNPYLISLLESGDKEEPLRRVFAFLEQLAAHEDQAVREVVAVVVIQRLLADKALLAKARRYMGRTTLSMSHMVEDSFTSIGEEFRIQAGFSPQDKVDWQQLATTSPPARTRLAYAIVLVDTSADLSVSFETAIKVKKIVSTQAFAEAEVIRLNTPTGETGGKIVHFWRPTRLELD